MFWDKYFEYEFLLEAIVSDYLLRFVLASWLFGLAALAAIKVGGADLKDGPPTVAVAVMWTPMILPKPYFIAAHDVLLKPLPGYPWSGLFLGLVALALPWKFLLPVFRAAAAGGADAPEVAGGEDSKKK
mmetsp:Transcript_23901/g.66443  ORF Transcript_23901/g.66443 Transcript_23901/m.66443 type:complete len:129 (-) Transcript_23901:101-487(-)